MKKTHILAIFFVALVIAVFFFLKKRNIAVDPNLASTSQNSRRPVNGEESDKSSTLQKSESFDSSQNIIKPESYPLWKGGRATNLEDQRWKIRRERQKNDPEWQGKMAIEFYGKIVDENSRPVDNATVKFSWTNLSPEGSTQRVVQSDANGLFSITQIKGKRLGVTVTKDGYDRFLSKNPYTFEYASFGDEFHHDPNPSNPVIFYLRKKGIAEPLKYREEEIKIKVGEPLAIVLDGGTKLKMTLQSNTHPKQGKWEAQVVMQNGGLVPAIEEFNAEAPASGYQSAMVLNSETPKPPTWQIYQGGSFYFKAGQNYGRMDIEMVPGKDWFRLTTWLNPSGSRNLEYDPAKKIQ